MRVETAKTVRTFRVELTEEDARNLYSFLDAALEEASSRGLSIQSTTAFAAAQALALGLQDELYPRLGG